MGRADEILDIAQEMIQTRGYNAFSFQDISTRMGIKKASVQFYFPKKVDLGCKVVQRYAQNFEGLLDSLDADPEMPPWTKFETYLKPFIQVSEEAELVCLCGVLGGEFVSLPKLVQHEVAAFFVQHETWLACLLKEGRSKRAFAFKGDAGLLGKTIFAAFQGALIIARSRNEPTHFRQVAEVLRGQLRP